MSKIMQDFIDEFHSRPVEFSNFNKQLSKSYDGMNRLVYPGSFNPLHSQHVAVMLHAMKNYSKRYIDVHNAVQLNPVFEISKTNCDKPDVTDTDLIKRIKTITATNFNVMVTQTPKFAQKNAIFMLSRYILGLDTFMRMIDIKYHYDNYELMCRNLKVGNNEYLIYPRGVSSKEQWNSIISSVSKSFESVPELFNRFIFVSYDSFIQNDISSTEIRNELKKEKNV